LTILITGGAGYVGSQIAHRLADLGQASVIVDDLSTGSRAAVPAGIPLIVGKVEDERLVRQAIREHQVVAVMHLAGSGVVEESVRDPLKCYRNNACATMALLQCCISEGVRRFIFSSSAAVYGYASGTPIAETAPRLPASPYGWSKLMSEVAIENVGAAEELDFNVAGSDPQLRTGPRSKAATHLIKVASEVALGRRAYLPIFGSDYPTSDGTCVRDFIHVWDLAELHVAALRHLTAGGTSATFNCGYGRGFSVLEVVKAFERVTGWKLATRLETRRPGDLPIVVSEAALVRKALRWIPQFESIDAMVSSALAWERKNP
jgi:UDP-glucose 4-epimerase